MRRATRCRLLHLANVGVPILSGLVDDDPLLLLLDLYLVRTVHVGPACLDVHLLHAVRNLLLLFFFFPLLATLLSPPLFFVEFVALGLFLVL